MRFVVLLTPLLLIAAACSANPANEETAGTSADLSAGCSLSRATILNSVSAARRQVIERGFSWLDANVPYSQSKTHEGYRTDCSGFVSMCWQVGAPGLTTSTFPSSGKVKMLASYNDLVPGDALDDPGHHSLIFLGWNDAAKSGICVLEQASTASDMQFRVRTTASLKGAFKPMRSINLVNDTATTSGAGGDNATDTDDDGPAAPSGGNGTGTKPAPTPTPAPAPAPAPSCVRKTPTEACESGFQQSGFECGAISDGCGGTVNCDAVDGFGCLADESCTANRCVLNKTCVAKTAADACNAAKSAQGIQCGSISDGCGGSVSCDQVPSFGCTSGSICGANNKCVKTSPTSGDAPPGTGTTQPPTPTGTDEGDGAYEGEPGDVPSSGKKSKGSSSTTGSGAIREGEPVVASGCSASAGGVDGSSGSVLALMLAACFIRRRKQRTS